MKFTETQEFVGGFFGIILILFGVGASRWSSYSAKIFLERQAAKAAILHGADIPSITVVREWIGLSALQTDSQPGRHVRNVITQLEHLIEAYRNNDLSQCFTT